MKKMIFSLISMILFFSVLHVPISASQEIILVADFLSSGQKVLKEIKEPGSREVVNEPDNIPTGPVVNFAAISLDSEVRLTWQNPATAGRPGDNDFCGAKISRESWVVSDVPDNDSSILNTQYTRQVIYDGIVNYFTDTAVTNGVTYTYTIQAFDSTGNYSDSVSVNATPFDNIAPAAVTDLEAPRGLYTGEILLSWTATGDNGRLGGDTLPESGVKDESKRILNSPPLITRISPKGIISGESISIEADIKDDTEVKEVNIKVDGHSLSGIESGLEVLGVGFDGQYAKLTIRIDRELSTGNNVVEINVWDDEGNRAAPEAWKFEVTGGNSDLFFKPWMDSNF